jgi:two-component system, chemotaxis family, protein-glutamate methylesterase/glutaminase
VHLSHGAKENHTRPAIDPLFRSAALAYQERVAGVILTGGLDDGTSGLAAIKAMGGTTIVQDPAEAEVPSMPASAMRNVAIDFCLPLAQIPPILTALCKGEETARTKIKAEKVVQEELKIEVAMAAMERVDPRDLAKLGEPSVFACPECHGVLFRIKKGRPPRFRCHTGHAYTAAALQATYAKDNEDTLWSAVRSLEEYALLLNDCADSEDNGEGRKKRALAEHALRRAAKIREALTEAIAVDPES